MQSQESNTEQKLKVGDIAPDFNSKDFNGKTISLNECRGKKVILYFYPKDNTPGCTAEACNLRDNYSDLLAKGFIIIGVSADNEKSHKNFIDKYTLPFPLIADTDKKIITAYGAIGNKLNPLGVKRITFVISAEGKIEKIFDKVDTKNHTKQIFQGLKN